jgi:acyl-[acyl-carrier-protein]-phospholipid O-acyltransferase/long-chain-fatty-acid--[acyl-carrier-protein] ligase
MKWFLGFLVRLLYGFKGFNMEVLRTPGPVLLVPNHVSWLDWLFVGLCLEDDWRFVVSSASAQTSWLHRKIMLNRRTFPIDTDSPYAVKRMAEFLERNGRLVLFAEGRLSRTGALMKLFEGTGFLLHKTSAKVITCYLRGAQRLPHSPNQEKKKWFPKISVHFSKLLTPPKVEHLSAAVARTHLTNWLRDQMVLQQFETEMQHGAATVPEAIASAAKLRPGFLIMEDLLLTLTFRRLLIGANLFAKVFGKELLQDTRNVGVLLPNVVATPISLLALWKLGKVPAILNYTTGPATMLACAQVAGLKQIITSRNFLARAKLDIEPLAAAGLKILYVEDLRKRSTGMQRLMGLIRVSLAPGRALRSPVQPQDTAVILFTSGSEAAPKGVELTHHNLMSNLRQMISVIDIQDWDRIFNSLPIFHSFGLTIGTLLPLVRGVHGFLFPSPLRYRAVPTALYDRDCTIMLSTNTFLHGYARKAHPMDFRSLRYLFAGAEKIQESVVQTWSQRFGVRVLEGYGATECSPVISVNTPLMLKFGTAGRLLPGIEYKLEQVEGVAEGGRLLVRGPNVMRGYLNPEPNAKFKSLGGWYDTGDMAKVDDERFVTILGRLKRFAKISGEMVSLTAVEEALSGGFPQYGMRFQVAVISRPDPGKGEMLIAVSNEPRLQLDEIRAALRAKGLPNICVPREVKFVKELPHLGTGKINHRALETMV